MGLYILSELQKIDGFKCGLYRDDGLGVSTLPKRVIEHSIKKKIIEIFEKCDLKIVVNCNQVSVDFLNVNLDLKEGVYKPFRKPNNEILYISKKK